MKQYWIKVLRQVIRILGFTTGILIADWLWKHIVGR